MSQQKMPEMSQRKKKQIETEIYPLLSLL